MAAADSALDPDALALARALLEPPAPRPPRMWPALAAAAFAAVCALGLAVAMVIAPPVVADHSFVDQQLR
ncbi:hypothetical protein [Phenylobacterium sp.]|uniref:hypothetical protein n=1 Tax=Phenylobacterium sp. TaxID=1871053 RepID=UPI002F3EE26F